MRAKLTNTQRQAFATRALSEPVTDIAREAGVQPSTVYDWMKRFEVSVPASTAPSKSLTDASLTQRTTANDDANYRGVKGALPPDSSKVSYWRAERWKADHSREPIVDIVSFPDGRHGLAVADASRNPRRQIHETFAVLGAFAGVGRSPHDAEAVQDFRDESQTLDESAGRATWWRGAREMEDEDQLRWMMAVMHGEEFSTMSADERRREPSTDELWGAAHSHHDRTGEFALPVFHTSAQSAQFRLGDPENPGGASGFPVGFIVLGARQAESLREGATWEQVHGFLKETLDIYNDWRDGNPVEATSIVFANDPDEEPVDVPTGFMPSTHLAEVARMHLEEIGAGYFA